MIALSSVCAMAGSVTFFTPAGSTIGGEPVNAQAIFTTGAGTLTITLQDLQANPTDVGQLLSDLQFTLSTGDTTASLFSSSADFITIASNGSVTDNGTGSTGWGFGSGTLGAGNYLLCVICGAGVSAGGTPPSEAIIGPGPYTSANPSIAGNGPHNPFINQTATFTIHDSNITASTVVSKVTFSFGTAFGSNVIGVPTPEPRSTVVILAAFALMAVVYRRRKKALATA